MEFFHVYHRAHRDRPATGAISVFDTATAKNLSTGREVGSLDDLD